MERKFLCNEFFLFLLACGDSLVRKFVEKRVKMIEVVTSPDAGCELSYLSVKMTGTKLSLLLHI